MKSRAVRGASQCEVVRFGVRTAEKGGLHYTLDPEGGLRHFKPWLGDAFSFIYDMVMEKNIFPRKFDADIGRHYSILAAELEQLHDARVVEMATGSDSAVNFLPGSVSYTGSDISPGLLRRAVRAFSKAGFPDASFFVASADELPFTADGFTHCLRVLALIFFPDADRVFAEAACVLEPGGGFIGVVPVPERIKPGRVIRGRLHTIPELEKLCSRKGISFEQIPAENGALLYFTSELLADNL